jgi:type VI secretion system protein ImpC
MPKQPPHQDAPPPRVEIVYNVDWADGHTEPKQLPFVIAVLADLEGQVEFPKRFKERRFQQIDADNIDSFMAKLAPRLQLVVDDKLSADGAKTNLEVRFRRLDDFAPLAVAMQVPALNALLGLRERLNNLRSTVHANNRLDDLIKDAILGWGGERGSQSREELIDRLVGEGHFGRFAEDQDSATQSLDALFVELDAGRMVLSRTVDAMLAERMARIDDLLSAQLNEVFHHAEFQRLEASWRGLDYLVRHTATSWMLKIKVLAVSKKEVYKDLIKAVEFDQTQLFRMIYEEEYGTLGGQPYAALIGDYAFDRSSDDMEMLEKLSGVAAAAGAPFVGAALPGLFNLDSFRDLSGPRDLAKIFDNDVYAKWHSFRMSDDSRYVGLVLPRVLGRLPYGREGLTAEGLDYEEGVDGKDPEKYLWGNAVYAFAARLTEAFERYGWCAAITGMERGGVVRDLPTQRFVSDDGDEVTTCPTEIAITDRRREELQNLGFIPLCYEKGSDRAIFFQAHSCSKPQLGPRFTYIDGAAESAMLEYVFAVSRFYHYIRVIMRAKAETFQNRRELERYLNEWLSDYVLLEEDAAPEVLARFPLREGRIEVAEVAGRPGRFNVRARLRPHFQLKPPETGLTESVYTIGMGARGFRYGG